METIRQIEKQNQQKAEIMNYLYNFCSNIELYSTFELERIISYTNYNPQKTMNLVESFAKEEIMRMIEEYDLKIVNQRNLSSKINIEQSHQQQQKKRKNEVVKIGLYNQNQSIFTSDEAWNFLHSNVNIIDMKDLLHTYDQYKLISNAKSKIKDKDNYKLNEYFEKFDRDRERKFHEVFKANLEDNDIKYMEIDDTYKTYDPKKTKKNQMELQDESSHLNFYNSFFSSPDVVKSTILQFCDIFSIGKLGLVDKKLNDYIYRKFNLEEVAKNYCLSIYKHSGLYVNDQKTLNSLYKSYMAMFANRMRIRFSGVYYCRVKYIKVGEYYGVGERRMNTVFYYRYYRFLPTGEVFSMTGPYVKNKKILQAIAKNDVELRQGRFYVDVDNTVVIELFLDAESSYIYRYKVHPLSNFRCLLCMNGLISTSTAWNLSVTATRTRLC